jgi:UTP--glucose-1-phosphate uridylyltransferase
VDIIKTIIPAAGLGKRFLPFTKGVPKVLLPILNKPALQYIVEEALASNIDQILLILGKQKQAIQSHLEVDIELEMLLKERGCTELLNSVKQLTHQAHFTYVAQPEPLGLGHAIWMARHLVGKEHFAIQLPDDLIFSKTPALAQLIKIARQEKASVIAVQEVPSELIQNYGIIGIKRQITPNLYQVSHLVEKPDPKDAPSQLAVVGRYVLSHKIFAALESIEADKNGELQLTDAIAQMMFNNEKVFAYKVQGIRHDIGTPLGWIKAIIGTALQDAQLQPHISSFLADREQLDTFIYNQAKFTERAF